LLTNEHQAPSTVQSQRIYAGDVDATKLVKSLLEKACEPYFSMLELWLCQGVLNDPYSEFMVEEDKVEVLSCIPALPFS